MNKDAYWGEICEQIDEALKFKKTDRRQILEKNCGDNVKLFTDCSNYLSFIETAENIDFLENEIELHSKLFAKLKLLRDNCNEKESPE